MQCKCGGYITTKTQPITRNRRVIGIKELDVCQGCKRNAGPQRIYSVDRSGHKDRFLQEG